MSASRVDSRASCASASCSGPDLPVGALFLDAILPLGPYGKARAALERGVLGVEGLGKLPGGASLPGHVRYGCGRDDARTAGTARHKCADRQRAAALALPQSEKLGIDDVVGAGISAGAESDRAAFSRSGF